MKKSKIIVSLMLVVCLAFSCFATGCSESVNLDDYYKYKGLAILLPEGFTVMNVSGVTLACGPDYPEKTDNITFADSERDSLDKYTEELLLKTFQIVDKSLEKFDVYEKVKLNNVDVVHIKMNITYDGEKCVQTTYYALINGKVISVTFTSTSGTYDTEFENSGKTIRAE